MRDLGLAKDGELTLKVLRVWRTTTRGKAPAVAAYAKLTTRDYYIDPQSFLPLIVRFNTHADDDAERDIPVEIRFADYRYVSGVRVPFRIQKLLNGSVILDITVTSATINSGLPALSLATH